MSVSKSREGAMKKKPTKFASYIHDIRSPLGILSICCEGPECEICAADPEAAKRANNRNFPWPEK